MGINSSSLIDVDDQFKRSQNKTKTSGALLFPDIAIHLFCSAHMSAVIGPFIYFLFLDEIIT